MAVFEWRDVAPIVPNTTMRVRLIDGVARIYAIKAVEGYVLHDINYDTVDYEPSFDPETGEEVMVETNRSLGYHTAEVSCPITYDFSTTEMSDDEGNIHTAYGSRQFFTRPIADVPADQIFGVTDNEHEIA